MIPTKKEWTDALIARHGSELHQRFSAASVAVCGLGGLGSSIAIALARAIPGAAITGADLSAGMLASAARASQRSAENAASLRSSSRR